MTDAGSIRESKLIRLRDPNLEKMEPIVQLLGVLREKSQERGEPRSHAPGARRAWWRRVFGG